MVVLAGQKYGIRFGKPTSGGSYGDHLKSMDGLAKRFNDKSIELNGRVTSLRRRTVKALPFMMGI